MTNRERGLIYLLAGLAFGIMLFLVAGPSQATGKNITINNYYETPQEPDTIINQNMTITEGISHEDLAKGLATAGANNHQFDFSTLDYQASVVGAFYDGENALSLGIAKRFDSIGALWHGSFTENGGKELVTIGATFRF